MTSPSSTGNPWTSSRNKDKLVLVVDDDEGVLDFLEFTLHREGFLMEKAYEAGAITLEQLKARNEANRQQTDALQKDIMTLGLQIARQGGEFSRARLEERLNQFRERLQQASFDELRALIDPLIGGILLFNEKAEELAPVSVVGRRGAVLMRKAKELLRPKEKMGVRFPLGAIPSERDDHGHTVG